MNILNKFTKLDLKLNKKRTIGTIVGIMLATALITVVGGMMFVLRNTMVQGTINSSGYYHIELFDVNNEDLEEIKHNKDFSHMEILNYTGDFLLDEESEYIDGNIYSMSEDTFNYLKKDLEEGTFPKNNKEIIISKSIAKTKNVKVGDNIKIFTGSDIVSNDGIVGIYDSYGDIITTDTKGISNIVYLTLKNPNNYVKDISELLGVENYKIDRSKAKYAYSLNDSLLDWEVFDLSKSSLNFLYTMVGVIIGIILLTSVFSIRNSFAISTNEKLKTYGMLSSIGATKKQIRRMVLLEGFYVGLIGITLGVVLGEGVIYLLTQTINALAANANMLADGWMFYYKFSIYPILMAVVVSIVMIYLSTISSSIKAGRVAPIQNIRNSDKIKAKKLRVPFFIRKIFKIGGTISYKNLKRSRKKYRVTVISLTVSILVFISASSFLEYGLKEIKNEIGEINYNFEVSEQGNAFDGIDVKALANLDKSHTIYRYGNAEDFFASYELYDNSHITNTELINLNVCTKHDKESSDCIEYGNMVRTKTFYYDDETFKEYLKMLKLNYEDNKDKVIILNEYKYKKKIRKYTSYKKNDIITLEDKQTNTKISYKVGAVTGIRPWGTENNYTNYIVFIANQKYYDGALKLVPSKILYETKDPKKLEENIEKIVDGEDVYIENISETAKQLKTLVLIFSIFVYGFIIVVTLIGVTSVFNTINSNMELRKREFATLKSIGMTKREFNNMILLESIFYSLKSLFFGTILGIGGSYLVYKAFASNMDFGYTLPIKAIIISVVFIIILVYIIMKYSIDKTNKQNIIETIRKENI